MWDLIDQFLIIAYLFTLFTTNIFVIRLFRKLAPDKDEIVLDDNPAACEMQKLLEQWHDMYIPFWIYFYVGFRIILYAILWNNRIL